MAKNKLPNEYVFPAILEDYGDYVIVKFPDLKDCYATGKGYDGAIEAGRDALSLRIQMLELTRTTVPDATPIDKVGVSKKQVVDLIDVNMKLFRARLKGNCIGKSVKVPEYLIMMAETAKINIDEVLKVILIEKLKK